MQVWLTVEEAAVKTGMSVRTLQRRIASGAMQSRLENARREVLVDLPEQADGDAAGAEQVGVDGAASSAGTGGGGPGTDIQLGAGLTQLSHALAALADNADHKAEMAVVAYQGLARSAELVAGRYRTETRIYQVVAALLGLALLGAVGVAVRTYTVAGTLAKDVKKAEAAQEKLVQDKDQWRKDVLAAKEDAARAEGEALASGRMLANQTKLVSEQSKLLAAKSVRPTTRPSTLVDRVAGLLVNIPSADAEPAQGQAAEARSH